MKALVISGGGSKGAFAVGAVQYMFEQGHRWDVVVGTSTGALIAPLVATGDLDLAVDIYANVRTSDLLKRHCWITLPWRASLYDDTGLRNKIESNISPERFERIQKSPTTVLLCSVNLNTGAIQYWDPRSMTRDGFIRALRASSNIPGMMRPIEIVKGSDELHVDGGVREVAPIKAAADRGATDITAIVLSRPEPSHSAKHYKRILPILFRSLDLVMLETRVADVDVVRGRCGIDLKIIMPDDPIPGEGLEFEPDAMRALIREGYETARRTLSKT